MKKILGIVLLIVLLSVAIAYIIYAQKPHETHLLQLDINDSNEEVTQ